MTKVLSVEKARELLAFISKTNYSLSPMYDGVFASFEEASVFVESSAYQAEVPLSIVYEVKKGDYWESATVTFENDTWYIDDLDMQGKSGCGATIQESIDNFRHAHDITDEFTPVELVVNR